MCGIVGYTGRNNCPNVLMEGLEALEYRGYDSAGVAFFSDGEVKTLKSRGRLSILKEKLLSLPDLNSSCGIGHTRWATHGEPSDLNSHPHSTKKLSLVHNGIIENYREIEKRLSGIGYSFASDTDTERAAGLIDWLYSIERSPIRALNEARKHLVGAYAFAVIFHDCPNKIYAMRKESPLIVAKHADGSYLASDVTALLPYGKEYCRLPEDTVAELSEDEIVLYDTLGNATEPEYETADWNSEQAKKGGFPHFMLKEIYEEPSVLEMTFERYINDGLPYFGRVLSDAHILKSIREIRIVACGTAMHAGLVGKYICESLARLPANVEIASEFRYSNPILDAKTLVILLSQSGETADTLAALRYAKSAGAPTLAIVNVFGSSLAREADFVLYTVAGPEISVASTKAYTAQCAMLYLFAIHAALLKACINEEKARALCSELKKELPRAVAATLAQNDAFRELGKKISSTEHLFYIGRGIDYYLCVEASLKLKEISYIHSEAYAAGELKHGTISLISDGTPVIAFMTVPALAKKTESGISEVLSRGAKVYALLTPGTQNECALSPSVTTIALPQCKEWLYPFLSATAAQLLAYHTAAQKGLDVDKPRNLAKSVTVE